MYIQEILTKILKHAPTKKICTYCVMKEDKMVKRLTCVFGGHNHMDFMLQWCSERQCLSSGGEKQR